jgi:hypothetical protein
MLTAQTWNLADDTSVVIQTMPVVAMPETMSAIAPSQALLFRQCGSVPYVEDHSVLLKNLGIENHEITWIFPPHPSVDAAHATIIPDANVHRYMMGQTQDVNELKQSIRSLRLQSLFSHTKTTVETFLGIFGFQGKRRKDFVNAFSLPEWVEAWVSREDLKEEVGLRCQETADNTTHCSSGHESVQTLLDAWEEEQVSEDSYKRLMLMNISIFKGYRSEEPASVGQLLDALFEDHEALAKIVAEMLDDKSWVIRAKRSFRDPGGKTRRERFLAEVNAKRAASGKGPQV